MITHPVLGEIEAAGKSLSDLRGSLGDYARKLYPGSSIEVFLLNATVTVIGEVNRPGRYPLYKEQNSLSDALALAGDFQQYADRKTIKIIREIEGELHSYHIDLTDMESLSKASFFVQNDDIIVVSPLRRKKLSLIHI